MITTTIYFTAKNGADAQITGDSEAIDAIEKIFKKAGVRWNDSVETWDAGFYETKRKSQLGEP
jgi:hypothetical protein